MLLPRSQEDIVYPDQCINPMVALRKITGTWYNHESDRLWYVELANNHLAFFGEYNWELISWCPEFAQNYPIHAKYGNRVWTFVSTHPETVHELPSHAKPTPDDVSAYVEVDKRLRWACNGGVVTAEVLYYMQEGYLQDVGYRTNRLGREFNDLPYEVQRGWHAFTADALVEARRGEVPTEVDFPFEREINQ